jgi:DNA modification methylase
MQTTERKISELIPAEYNPRQLSDKQHEDLKASLTRFGAVDPAIVNIHPERKDIIVGGHQRLKVAKSLGWETFPCVEVNLTRDQERELNVRLNKNTGSWDWNILGNLFQAEELKEWGFSDEELFGNIEVVEAEAQEDNYEIPDEIETDIVLGDLIEIGEHRLLCGDSTDSDQVAKLMNGEKADMVFTDPPYGINVVQGNKVGGDKGFGSVGGDKVVKSKTYSEIIGDDTTDTARDFYNTCVSLGFENYIIWGGNYFTDFLPPSMCWLVWDKENTGNFADVELAWTSFDKSAKLYRWQWNGMIRKGDKTIEGSSRVHPTQKPVGLFVDIFNDFTFNICFDGFLGSGSTMVAAHQLNRKCYGMELDPKYCQVIVDRMLKLDPSLQVKINGE